MDPDQTAPKGAVWSGYIVFASMIKSCPKGTWIYAADVKSRQQLAGQGLIQDMTACQWNKYQLSPAGLYIIQILYANKLLILW